MDPERHLRRQRTVGRGRRYRLLSAAAFTLAASAAIPADADIFLIVATGPGAGEVTLQWSGDVGPYDVYASLDASLVVDPSKLLGTTSGDTWVDASPGAVLFYLVTRGACSPGTADCDGIVANGCECSTAACCGTSCEVVHDNGLGQTWNDCVALGTYNPTQATQAANAWAQGAPFSAQCSFRTSFENVVCVANTSDCACWAYESSGTFYAGVGWVRLVTNGSCACPVEPILDSTPPDERYPWE